MDHVLGPLREVERRFFFSRLKNPLWVAELESRGRFKQAPAPTPGAEGIVYPGWPEFSYLIEMIPHVPADAARIIAGLPRTENLSIHRELLSAMIRFEDPVHAASLLPRAQEILRLPAHHFGPQFAELLAHWAKIGGPAHQAALELLPDLVAFSLDSTANRRGSSRTYAGTERPAPKFDTWEYQELLRKGVMPLAAHEPAAVSLALSRTLTSFLELSGYEPEQDYSDYWCRRLETAKEDEREDPEEALVHTLTRAAELTYDRQPAQVSTLDRRLRVGSWLLLDRIRFHLYSLYPNEITRPWIRQAILERTDYGTREHRYEFQRMIRRALDHFGPDLLKPDELAPVFLAILGGPPREKDSQTEEQYELRRQHFHRRQLGPFRTALTGDARDRFEAILAAGNPVPTDEDYLPWESGGARFIETVSPKSVDELAKLNDEDLINFLNTWDAPHRHPESWWIEISHEGLGQAFEKLIEKDAARFAQWKTEWCRLRRHEHLRHAYGAAGKLLRAGTLTDPAIWLDLSRELLDRNAPEAGSNRMVGDFLEVCIASARDGRDVPLEACFQLLERLCLSPDPQLDTPQNEASHTDALTTAINSTRGRALETLVNYAALLHGGQRSISGVTSVLDARFLSPPPLTDPERALLATQVMRLYAMAPEWLAQNLRFVFPQRYPASWRTAFSTYLQFVHPYGMSWQLLQAEYQFALEQISTFAKAQHRDPVDALGEHLISFGFWELFPFAEPDSILSRYYAATTETHWAHLFDHVGRSLKNTGGVLPPEIARAAQAFFEWRLAQGNPVELDAFTFWLDAQGLDPAWRLQAFDRTLDVCQSPSDEMFFELKSLNQLLPEHPDLVVSCFSKLIAHAADKNYFYIQTDEAVPILRAGLASANADTRRKAEQAKEKLLQLGRFDFWDVHPPSATSQL